MLAIISAIFVIVAIYIFNFYQKTKKYPPGPTPLPFIGNMHQLPSVNTHKHIMALSEQYGPVFTIWMPHPTVVFTDFEHIKDALVKKADDYVGRTASFPDTIFQPIPNGGVIFSIGEEWKEERRNALHILRDFGMGKNIMEEQVKMSVQECVDHIKSMKDKKNVDLRWPIQLLVANVINITLFGYHYHYNDCQRVKDFCDNLANIFMSARFNKLALLAQRFPWIQHIPVLGEMAMGRFFKLRDKLFAHVLVDMERSLKDYTPDKEPETFTQAYVQRMKNNPILSYDRLKNVCMDFFLAGSETTSTTLRWGCIFMAQFPDVQEKCREEILEKLGKEVPSMKDRERVPYTSAAVMELQRMANILSYNVVHTTTRDTTCGRFSIPAGTRIQALIHAVLCSDPHFDHPEDYRPERFLAEDGKTLRKDTVERLIPFSMGKRQCAGEGLARMELFLGFVALLQNFRIKKPLNAPLNTTPIFGSVLLPPTNEFVIELI